MSAKININVKPSNKEPLLVNDRLGQVCPNRIQYQHVEDKDLKSVMKTQKLVRQHVLHTMTNQQLQKKVKIS